MKDSEMEQRLLEILLMEPRFCLRILARLSDRTGARAFHRLSLFCNFVKTEVNLWRPDGDANDSQS